MAGVEFRGRHGVGRSRRLLTDSRSHFSRLWVLMTISSAMHRLASRGPPCDPGVDAERLPDDEAATGSQVVPVVIPVRESSPGRSYGTADEGTCLTLWCSRLGLGFEYRGG